MSAAARPPPLPTAASSLARCSATALPAHRRLLPRYYDVATSPMQLVHHRLPRPQPPPPSRCDLHDLKIRRLPLKIRRLHLSGATQATGCFCFCTVRGRHGDLLPEESGILLAEFYLRHRESTTSIVHEYAKRKMENTMAMRTS